MLQKRLVCLLAAICCLLLTCVPLAAFAEGEETPEFEIPEDAVGMLTWQGTRFWKFEPEKKEE